MRKKLIVILIGVTFFAYFSSLGNPFIWDDEQFITSNAYVQQFNIGKILTTNTVAGAGITSNYYRPLTSLSFAIDAKMWGQNSFGFHLTNLILHIGAGVILFLLLLELGMGKWGSVFISLFFLIHPVQTEAVTYINSRGDSLYTCFLFGSLLLFLLSMRNALGRWEKWGMLGVAVLFILSLLSKEIALAGVGLFITIWAMWGGGFVKKRGSVWTIVTIGAIVVGYMVIRLTVLNFGNTLNFYGENNFYTTHLFVRLFTFAKVLWIYLGLLVFPYPLHMERSVDLVTSFWSPWVLGMVGLLGGVGVLGIWEIRKKGSTWILFGLIWFLAMLIPSSGIIPINGILYEHWLYIPMVGFFLVLYGVGRLILENSGTQKFRNLVLLSFGIVIAFVYILLTIHQNNIWADPITFYSYTLQFAPDSARLHNNLGMSLADTGDNKKAIVEYKRALSLSPGYPQIYNNLGNAQMQVGEYKDAEKNLKEALFISSKFTVAKVNLLKVYLLTKQFDKAKALFLNDPQVLQIIEESKKSLSN